MFDLDSMRVDPLAATEGQWFPNGSASFLIARHNNRLAENARNAALAPFYSKLAESMTDKVSEEDEEEFHRIQTRILCDHVLKGWKGVYRSGVEVEFTPDVAYELLVDHGFNELRQFILMHSVNRESFLSKNTAAIEKDVKPSAAS